MSPLARLYTSDGSLSVCSRSGYVIVLMPGTVFVALLYTRSTASMSRINDVEYRGSASAQALHLLRL